MSDKASTTDLHRLPTDEDLGRLQWTTVDYYLKETNPVNGLVRDKTEPNAPASIAAIGMALATYPVAVERDVLPRDFAARAVLKKLRFFRDSRQGCHGLQGLLLPLPRHGHRAPGLAVRTVHH
jgi:hypothetical protein